MRLRPIPLLVTAALGLGLPYLAAYSAVAASAVFGTASPRGPVLPWLYMHHAFQLLWGLVAIAVVRHFVPADYGLHWPRGRTYLLAAVLWGLAFGVLMTLVDYAPELMGGGRPPRQLPVLGWLFFEGVYVGPCEEVPFRALLVTYLAATMPGVLRIGRFSMNWAGVIVAALFAFAHFESFYTRPWAMALCQQFYAFALGVLYAYWLEKSRSVVTPMLGHNVSDVSETAIVMLWAACA